MEATLKEMSDVSLELGVSQARAMLLLTSLNARVNLELPGVGLAAPASGAADASTNAAKDALSVRRPVDLQWNQDALERDLGLEGMAERLHTNLTTLMAELAIPQ